MERVRDAAHFNTLVKGLKAGGKRVLTNSYLLPDEIAHYAARGRLHFISMDSGLLFLFRERDFFSAYYYLDARRFEETAIDLEKEVSAAPLLLSHIFVEGRVPDYLAAMEKFWMAHGLTFNGQFKRLTLNMSDWGDQSSNQDRQIGANKTQYAQKEQCSQIQMLWKNNLDVLSAALPFEDELEEAVERREIPVILDENGEIIAAMQFARKGRTAIINHVVVDQRFRRKGLAAEMLRDCFARSTDLKQVILWVEENNIPASSLYTKLGFRPDGKITRQLLLQ